jgi:hypothetical protein
LVAVAATICPVERVVVKEKGPTGQEPAQPVVFGEDLSHT